MGDEEMRLVEEIEGDQGDVDDDEDEDYEEDEDEEAEAAVGKTADVEEKLGAGGPLPFAAPYSTTPFATEGTNYAGGPMPPQFAAPEQHFVGVAPPPPGPQFGAGNADAPYAPAMHHQHAAAAGFDAEFPPFGAQPSFAPEGHHHNGGSGANYHPWNGGGMNQ